MALSKDKKAEVVAEISELLGSSKLTVIAKYSGTSVKSMQALRKQASEDGTTISVVKNRLVKKALESDDRFKDIDTSLLIGQLMYAFNSTDEVAPAQVLAKFAKEEPQIEFIGAYDEAGQLLNADDVKALAALPGKQQLRGQLVGTIAAPLSGFVNVISGNVRGVLNVLSARAEQLG
ncbi:50S ribosomal protein L10 [Candidatus Saccharibacteria bacterium]|nr:50S ribosomal protein L10 [Candidatus Saccharibacteria bacterium]